MIKHKKLKIGIFSFTSCAGCQFEILDLEDELLEIFKKADVAYFPMAKAKNKEGHFDVVFVEGAITTPKEIKEIKDIRKKAKFLVALGSCASYGGVPSIKDFYTETEIEVPVYKSTRVVKSLRADGIGNYVKVDYYMHGCPPNKYEFLNVLKDLLVGKIPKQPEYPVCKECRQNKNICLLQQGKPCMGPITNGGCDSICINNGIPCKGCRGPLEDANIDPIVHLYEKMGFTNEDIKKFFISFAGTSKIFSKIVGKTCNIMMKKEEEENKEKIEAKT
ncbi:MAG: oxidoreductase [Candidatus Woesearchaeota archaeon]|nr:oxidoreductase [Candidatus Woesearchaeota archaeon]